MKKIVLIITLLFATSCIRKTENSGYSFDEINTNNIQVGVTTKVNVLKDLGSPSFTSSIDKNSEEVWIYYSDRKDSYFFLRPSVKDQKVLALTFDKNNVLASKEQSGIEKSDKNPQQIRIVKDFTRKKENNDNIFVDIINNVGTVRSM